MLGLLAWLALVLQPCPAEAAQSSDTACGDHPVLYFQHDKSLGHNMMAETVPEKSVSPDEPWWTAHPCHYKYRFNGYPLPNAYEMGPAIYVFPMRSSYQSLYPHDPDDVWLREVNDLRTTLRDRPTWKPPTWQNGETITSPSLLPPINAANIYLARQKYITLPDGAGVRYISNLGQDPSPPSPDNTFYMFQGLLEDKVYGRHYYVSVVFPVFLSNPPTPGAVGMDENRLITDALERAGNADFNVDLARLDQMVASFELLSPGNIVPLIPISRTGAALTPLILSFLAAAFVLLAGGAALRLRNPIASSPSTGSPAGTDPTRECR
ncbi:MAG TPA: hypothetical protein VF952_08350 [Chloroflexia bacterium]|jgi:hypothetical protein